MICGGMTVFSAWSSKDCSGDRCQSSPNRALQYAAQNSQKDANQGVVSPTATSGLEEISQPFMTSRRKPFLTKRSRCTRVSSRERKTRRPPSWSASSSASDAESFSLGEAIGYSLSHKFFMTRHCKCIVMREDKSKTTLHCA